MSDDHIAWDRPPPPGHNQPPTPPEQWTERMSLVFAEATNRKEELLASYARFHDGFPLLSQPNAPPSGIERWNDDVQGRAGDLKAKISALLKEGSHLHGIEKAPVLEAARAIDGFFRQFSAELEAAVVAINTRRTAYAQYIESRARSKAIADAAAAHEEAARASAAAARTGETEELMRAADARDHAIAAQQIAAASPADLSRVHGPLGSVSSLRTVWKWHEEDSDLMTLARAVVKGTAPLSYIQFNATRLNLAVRTEKIRAIPGCAIREETVVR